MRNNVIILTSGLSGSSVLAGLGARAGYWTGDQTFRNVVANCSQYRRWIWIKDSIVQFLAENKLPYVSPCYVYRGMR